MLDIHFYRRAHRLKQALMRGEPIRSPLSGLDAYRSNKPVVYNIETTNACNQKCVMCPRDKMTRDIKTMNMDLFEKIVDQIQPWGQMEWDEWVGFLSRSYEIDSPENMFFLHIIPQVLTLHGYGDPTLDKFMPERIKLLKDRGIPSYMSVNTQNLDMEKALDYGEAGLNYLKYSGTDLNGIVRINALATRFKQHDYDTHLIVCIVDTGDGTDFLRLRKLIDPSVMVYVKSQDNRWYRKNENKTASIHWSEFCQFPWSSMSVMADGSVVPCCNDYDCDLVLGNANTDTLKEIWSGASYDIFRENHAGRPNFKCGKQCDMKLLGDM